MFTMGNLESTGNNSDFAIEGEAFFVVDRGNGDIVYTRDGSFKVSLYGDGVWLTTSEGYPVLNADGDPITIPDGVFFSDVSVDETGAFFYTDANNVYQSLGFQFELVQFTNRQGLEAVGGNFYRETAASGAPLSEAAGDTSRLSRIRQNYLEMSNVQVADEMVNLIIAQRAYEINSKVITTSDEMLQQANNLKR
jgi:flagellar basal-body rod protein FlgG